MPSFLQSAGIRWTYTAQIIQRLAGCFQVQANAGSSNGPTARGMVPVDCPWTTNAPQPAAKCSVTSR